MRKPELNQTGRKKIDATLEKFEPLLRRYIGSSPTIPATKKKSLQRAATMFLNVLHEAGAREAKMVADSQGKRPRNTP